MRRSGRWVIAVLGPAALVAGCGESHHAIGTRPAEPIMVTALIDHGRVKVSPTSFGAGPVQMIVSNQSGSAQRVTFETASSGPGIRSSTAVPLGGIAELQVSPGTGSYQVSVRDQHIRPASVKVGAKRPSSQNELLRP